MSEHAYFPQDTGCQICGHDQGHPNHAKPAAPQSDQPRCVGYPDCDGDLPGEAHEPECPAYRAEVDGPLRERWEKTRAKLESDQPAQEEQKLELKGHAWLAWLDTCFDPRGRAGRCECGNSKFRYLTYTQHQKHLASLVIPASQPAQGEREFIDAILDALMEGGALDECEIEELGVKCGLLIEFTVTEPCREDCACAEIGFPTKCYRRVVAPAVQPSPASADARELAEKIHAIWLVHSGSGHAGYIEKATALLESFRAETLAEAKQAAVDQHEKDCGLCSILVQHCPRTESNETDCYPRNDLRKRMDALGSDPNWLARQITQAREQLEITEVMGRSFAEIKRILAWYDSMSVGDRMRANLKATLDIECPYIYPKAEDAVAIHPYDLYELVGEMDGGEVVDVLKHSDSSYREPIGLWHIKGVWYRQDASAPRRPGPHTTK